MDKMKKFSIRKAVSSDSQKLTFLMKDSVEEQKLKVDLQLTAKDLERDVFGSSPLFTIYVSQTDEGQVIGYILTYYYYSTMVGKAAFIEDIFVAPEYRKKGVGSALWRHMTQAALDSGCRRSDIIAKGTIPFLQNRGAVDLSAANKYLVFRLEKEAMENYIKNCKNIDGVKITRMKKENCATISKFVQDLYEILKASHEVKIDAKDLERDGFGERPIYRSFVAEKNGAIAGYCLFFFSYHLDGLGVLMEDLYVSADHRGTGIGSLLWRELIKESLEYGCRRCSYLVDAKNAPAIRFYKHKGAVDTTNSQDLHYYRVTQENMEKYARA